METLKYAEETGFDSVSIHMATPLPGTELYDICKEQNLFVEDYEIGKNQYEMGNIKTKDFNPEELSKLCKEYTKRINEGLKERNEELYKKKYAKISPASY